MFGTVTHLFLMNTFNCFGLLLLKPTDLLLKPLMHHLLALHVHQLAQRLSLLLVLHLVQILNLLLLGHLLEDFELFAYLQVWLCHLCIYTR